MVFEMTSSVRLCLSYGTLNLDFIAFKMNIISVRKDIVDTDVFYDITCMCQSVIAHVFIRFL